MRHQAHHQKTPEPTLSYCLWGLSTVGTHLHVTHLSVRESRNPRNSLCESRGSELSLTFRFVNPGTHAILSANRMVASITHLSVRDNSYLLFKAAWAAASLAIGTRNGEQDT